MWSYLALVALAVLVIAKFALKDRGYERAYEWVFAPCFVVLAINLGMIIWHYTNMIGPCK